MNQIDLVGDRDRQQANGALDEYDDPALFEQRLQVVIQWLGQLKPPQRVAARKALKQALSGQKDADLSAKARDVLGFLNQQRQRHWPRKSGLREVDANLKHIRARLAEGADVGTMRAVAAVKCRQAAEDPERFRPEWCAPSTLFNSEKFWKYEAELNRGEPGQ